MDDHAATLVASDWAYRPRSMGTIDATSTEDPMLDLLDSGFPNSEFSAFGSAKNSGSFFLCAFLFAGDVRDSVCSTYVPKFKSLMAQTRDAALSRLAKFKPESFRGKMGFFRVAQTRS